MSIKASDSDAATSSHDRGGTMVAGAWGAGVGLSVVAVNYERADLELTRLWWVAPAAIAVGVAVGLSLAWFGRRRMAPGVVPMAIVSALVASYLCVPETDQFRVGLIVPVAVVLIELVVRRPLPGLCYGVAAASIGWAAMFGANGRSSAYVGALFAWWAVILAPLVGLFRPMRHRVTITVVAAIGSIAAVAASRTGGIAESGRTAVLMVAAVALVSGSCGFVVAQWEINRDAPNDDAVNATPRRPVR